MMMFTQHHIVAAPPLLLLLWLLLSVDNMSVRSVYDETMNGMFGPLSDDSPDPSVCCQRREFHFVNSVLLVWSNVPFVEVSSVSYREGH